MRRGLIAWALMSAAGALTLSTCGGYVPDERLDAGGPRCVSGTWWTFGDRGDNTMHPGRECISCHRRGHRGPLFSVAGTIFSSYHEADDCNGYPGGPPGDPRPRAEVEVTDATGRPFFIIANRVGNFYTNHQFQLPIQRVRVRGPNGRFLEMAQPPPHGDCNACHSRDGNVSPLGVSPGRITVPP